MDKDFIIRKAVSSDALFIKELMDKHWGGEPLIVHGQKYYPSNLNGLLLFNKTKIEGFLFYDKKDHAYEIIVFEVFHKFKGLGSLIFSKFLEIAKEEKCKKILVMTTNDNLDGLRFYQRKGFFITGISINALEISRKMKPCIPKTGDYGILVRDEILLEFSI